MLIVEEVDVDELFVVLDEIVEEMEGFEDDEEEEEEEPSLLQPTNVRERSKGKKDAYRRSGADGGRHDAGRDVHGNGGAHRKRRYSHRNQAAQG